MTTLLQHAKDITDEIGINRPSVLVGSTDITARRLLAAAKAAGEGLFRAHNWTILHREHIFDTTEDEPNYAVPDDWGRPLGDTAWDRDQFWKMRGNKSPQEWQFYQSALLSTPTQRKHYRLIVGPLAGSILIFPTPTADGETLVIEYVSRFWCEDSDGNGQGAWEADTDVIRLDTELFRLGFLYRAKRAFAPPYADELLDYQMALKDSIKADVNMPRTNMGRQRTERFANIPEGDWA